MKFERDSSVVLTKVDGTPLQEVSKGSSSYAVAQPGEEFLVKLDAGNGLARYLVNPNKILAVWVQVDGVQLGYFHVINQTPSSVSFEGFLNNTSKTVDVKGHTVSNWSYSRFKFADVQKGSSGAGANTSQPASSDKGRVVVSIYKVHKQAKSSKHQDEVHYNHKLQSAPAVPEGKKWFMAPSVQAAKGSGLTKQQTVHRYTYSREGGPVATVTLHYETASTLQLRGILDSNNPTHQSILDSALAHVPEDDPAEAAAQAGPSSSSRQRRSQPEMVDLTKDEEPRIKVEGREIQRDEFAVCDMTAGVAAPAWEVRKKPRVELD